ncbi:MAG: hypothetical protein U0169_08840 [Polyangiaceae bacterium]
MGRSTGATVWATWGTGLVVASCVLGCPKEGASSKPAVAPDAATATRGPDRAEPATGAANGSAESPPAPTASTGVPVSSPDGAVRASMDAASEGTRPNPRVRPDFVSACKDVVLELSVPNGKPDDAKVTLVNKGRAPVELMTAGDGSSDGRRNPTVLFELTPNEREPVGLCGMMNSLAAEDFVTLAPGARHAMGWTHAPRPAKPGKYTLRVTYRNDPKIDPVPSGAKKDPALQARAQRTVACELVSNAVSFEWKGTPGKP